jgi:biopolymer transport protein ExbD
MVVEPLKLALQQQAARVLAQPADGPEPPREVTIMGDKSVPYAVLRKVMATCTDADYGKVSLVVVEKETAVGGTTA